MIFQAGVSEIDYNGEQKHHQNKESGILPRDIAISLLLRAITGIVGGFVIGQNLSYGAWNYNYAGRVDT